MFDKLFGRKANEGEKPAGKAWKNPAPEPYMGVMQARYLLIKYDEASCSLIVRVEGKETVSTAHSPEYGGITVEFDTQRNRTGYVIPLQRFKKHHAMKLPIWTEVGRENLSIMYDATEIGSGPLSIGLDPAKYDFSSDDPVGQTSIWATRDTKDVAYDYSVDDIALLMADRGRRLKFGYLNDEELEQMAL